MIAAALAASPARAKDREADEIRGVKNAWYLITDSACNTDVVRSKIVDVPENTAVTVSYTRSEPQSSYAVVCYRSGDNADWVLWTAFATEVSANRGVVTLGPYPSAFQVMANVVVNRGPDDVEPMARYARISTYGGVALDFFDTPDGKIANTRIDLTLTGERKRD